MTDIQNVPLKVGQRIAYVHQAYSSASVDLCLGYVVRLTAQRVGVMSTFPGDPGARKKSALKMPSKIVVLEEPT